MLSQGEQKQKAGEYAVQFVKQGMTIGIGTGSTVYYFIKAIARQMQNGLTITGVPTSHETEQLMNELNIPLADINEVRSLDLTIDGADETDHRLELIKGGGGALLREKIVAAASRELIIIADYSKLVSKLGKFPLPVEVIPFGWKQTWRHILEKTSCRQADLRMKNSQPFITDHGHYILDCHFEEIKDYALTSQQLNDIPGVVENGLFISMARKAIIAYPDGSVKEISR
jgi:ribose 5-phosphate isomerase A